MPVSVNMTQLEKPLLCEQPQDLRACSPLFLRVLRYNASLSSVASKNGDVVFRLHKPKPFNPFCGIEWHLSDDINDKAPAVVVKKGLLASSTTFETADGLLLTIMTQKMFSPYCEFTFEDCTYRWSTVGCMVPLQLQLNHVASGQQVAALEGSVSMPWSRLQQHITIFANRDDPIWLQIVIASGLAEAKRLGGENSSTTPRRYAQQQKECSLGETPDS